jgi:hypothetical protein
MLDLKKLEEKLDKALANETEESLSRWLFEKRGKSSYLSQLGAGEIESQKSINDSFLNKCTDVFFTSKNNYLSSENSTFGMAA